LTAFEECVPSLAQAPDVSRAQAELLAQDPLIGQLRSGPEIPVADQSIGLLEAGRARINHCPNTTLAR
jgi:hypothetical protein